MGSMVLPYSLASLTITPSSGSLKPGLNVSQSLSTLSLSSSCISISRASSCRFEPTLASPVVPRRRRSTALSASSSLGEEETAGDVEAVQALENEAAEENLVGPDSEAEAKPPRKPIIKLGDIMGILNKRAVEASEKERPVPDIRTGDIVMIKMVVKKNRRRAAIYKGIVMSRQNAGNHTTIRIRRIIAGVGVEIVFPLYSPNIKEIQVISHRKVRRARLYFLRDKLPRLSTFK